MIILLSGCAARQTVFPLTIAHINDTHGQLAPASLSLQVDNATVAVEAAGFARLSAILAEIRREHPQALFVHSGDVFQGTLFFHRFAGRADCTVLNALGLTALAPGNHEFDRGPSVLSDFAAQADFALLSANMDVTREPLLQDRIHPFFVKEIDGRRIGIIGLTAPDTPQLSQPGSNITFLDPVEAAKKAIAGLARQGIYVIIILSHLGYEQDRALAAQLPEVDVIAGGHSHTLLGDFSAVGLSSDGPYPTVCRNADNDTVLIVQAWHRAQIVGRLTVDFNGSGAVSGWSGTPLMPVGKTFTVEQDGGSAPATVELQEKIRLKLAATPGIITIDEDPAIRSLIAPYAREIDLLYKQRITRVPKPIEHVRLPDAVHPQGSPLAGLVAQSTLWKMQSIGIKADAALINAGAVRGSIPPGYLTVGQVYEILPFADSLVLCTITGGELQQVIESGINRALSGISNGAYPYGARLRFRLEQPRRAGKRMVKIELRNAEGRWRPLDKKKQYRIVTSSYLMKGSDGYEGLARLAPQALDTGFVESEAFMEYAARAAELRWPPRHDTTVQPGGK